MISKLVNIIIILPLSTVLCHVEIISKTCSVSDDYILMGISYTTPLHRRNVFTKIKFQEIKQNRWIEGKNCNNTLLNSSIYVSCQLFKVDPEDVFDIQLVLQNDTEIIAQKTVYASFDASRWFSCYADHNPKIISISSSNTSIGIIWKYNTYDRVQFLQSAQLQIKENGSVTHKVACKDATLSQQINCHLGNLNPCSYYNICILTFFNVGLKQEYCESVNTSPLAMNLQSPTHVVGKCTRSKETEMKLTWHSGNVELKDYYFTVTVRSNKATILSRNTTNFTTHYNVNTNHEVILRTCSICECSKEVEEVISSCDTTNSSPSAPNSNLLHLIYILLLLLS
ncbi:uncharacterized protein LOC130629171 isoform X2 [Hydractinia symbiolongicarpus]|uniref:uncharacterized protein LOC130629171 isoform X2 n=1 Tax=Hydractinia symbiolongicarpus TaxID=13093 RepID=UPI00254FC6D2|nr:uncharacterized protein LOC130629171 isoform X2 [Hydractinia symbiolongicarpus]XP_057298276.1 uncharacterized protein LOC130629171 isoform X2 [Hydractinia symbiolongicarpus]